MGHSAKAVANAFLDIAENEGESLSHAQIQKLVYVAHGWSLGVLGKPLIREKIQAWKHCPTIQSLYHEFSRFGDGDVTQRASNLYLDERTLKILEEIPRLPVSDSEVQGLICRVWEVYGPIRGSQLTGMITDIGTPWSVAFNGGAKRIITNASLRSYYQALADRKSES